MHLSRHHKAMFFTDEFLRPGDGSVTRVSARPWKDPEILGIVCVDPAC